MIYKDKTKLRGCITSGMNLFGALLFFFVSAMSVYAFFDNEYSWGSLVIGTLWFIPFVFCLYCLLPQKNSKAITVIVCFVWCVVLIFSVIIGYVNRERDIEYNLLGVWVSENDEVKSKIIFEEDGNVLEGTWSFYDYINGKKEIIDFEVENIEDFTMEIATEDGDIIFIPFSVSKDTLYFDGIEHKNSDKNIRISKEMEKYNSYRTYVRNGVITPVGQGLFLGMSMDEVENIIKPAVLQKEIGYYQYVLPGTEISCHLDFFKGELHCIELYIEDIDSIDKAIDYLSNLYGEYTIERWSIDCDYIRYKWESYNLNININYNTKSNKYYWISYQLK